MQERLRGVPDGGWGWVIVACSFLIHLFVVGTLYALSVLYVSWLDAFQGGKGYTSWILSLAVAVMFGIGPLPAALARRFGNKKVVVVGGLLMFLGFLGSVFAVNVMYLICSVGIVTGVGAGFCYLPSVSMVAMYFNKKRSVAMGISASGLGVGAFLMPLYLNWMVENYSWRGCLLLLSGLSLNMCVLGLLMHPLESAPVIGQCKNGTKGKENFDEELFSSAYYDVDVDSLDEDEESCIECAGTREDSRSFVGSCQPPIIHILTAGGKEVEIRVNDITPCTTLPHRIINSRPGSGNSLKSSLYNSNASNCVTSSTKQEKIQNNRLSALKRDPNIGGSLQYIKAPAVLDKSCAVARSMVSLPREREEETSPLSFLSGMQIMMAGSLYNAVHSSRVVKSLRSLQSRSCTGIHECSKTSACPLGKPGDHLSECASNQESVLLENQVDHKNLATKKHTLHSKIIASLEVYIDLIQHGTFMLFCLSNFLTNLSFFMPVLYMVDRAIHEGFGKSEAAMLVSLYGVGNICGKLFFGWLADRGLVDRLVIYIGCLAVCGASTSLSPLCGDSHLLHSVYSFSFGCFIGSYCTLFPIVTVDLVGLDVVDESFGILLCFMGVATAFGAPLAGWIFDWTGSYDIAFILHGVFILISALMLVPLSIIRVWRKVW